MAKAGQRKCMSCGESFIPESPLLAGLVAHLFQPALQVGRPGLGLLRCGHAGAATAPE
jgi:hypothetical protein